MRRVAVSTGVFVAALLMVAVALASGRASRHDASRSPMQQLSVRTLPGRCTDSHRCHFTQGTYRLGYESVLPGLQLTLPRGWSSGENDLGELNLIPPPGHPGATLFVWIDLLAVKSTGPGHGTDVLPNVGTTPTALVSWLTTNPALLVVSPPRPARIAGTIPATTLTIGVSKSANYGDPACPDNPRCADLFTSYWWGPNSFGIGGTTEVQLSLARIKRNTQRHTLFVALAAGSGTGDPGLIAFRQAARSILSSFRLPKSITAG
jgi:hypothetical protein